MAQARKSRPAGKAKAPHASAFKWTPEIEEEILTRIMKGERIRNICNDDWLPSWPTVRKHLANSADFATRYTGAREAQAEILAGEAMDIADAATAETVAQARLQIDTRKWLAGKLAPKVYGERIDHTSSDGSMTPKALDASQLSTETLKELMGAIDAGKASDPR